MIYIQMGNNGLGNQLHVYALGLILQQKYGRENVVFDMTQLTSVVRNRKTSKLRNILGVDIPQATFQQVRCVTGMKIYKSIYKLLSYVKNDDYLYGYVNRLWKKRKEREKTCVIREEDLCEKKIEALCEMISDLEKDYYLIGYWRNIEFEEQDKQHIRNHIKIRSNTDLYRLYEAKIQKESSVSVHIRRGDYRRKEYSIQFCTCHRSYYSKAMSYIESLNKNVHYFIFSDDMDYVRKKYANRDNVTFVQGCTDYEDMLLMSKCDMNIIANSTFSYWGAFLNVHHDAIVVSPRTQYLKKVDGNWKSFPMSVPENWVIF